MALVWLRWTDLPLLSFSKSIDEKEAKEIGQESFGEILEARGVQSMILDALAWVVVSGFAGFVVFAVLRSAREDHLVREWIKCSVLYVAAYMTFVWAMERITS